MTDLTNDTNEQSLIPSSESFRQGSFEDSADDFSDDEDVVGQANVEGELTPNDIFGLDPLDVLTLEELAEYLKVSPAAAHRVIKEQKLPGRNIGGEWRFLRDAVANWLRGQEAPAQQQQKAREEYSKPKESESHQKEPERFSRPPQRPYQSEQSGGEYRPRQRFSEGNQQYGNQGGGQYGNRGGQYGSGEYGGGNQTGGYSRPPRRPFRAAEGSTEGAYGNQGDTGGNGGYGGGSGQSGGGGYGGGGGGGQPSAGGYGGGGYAGGGERRFGGGPKRKNKRHVFENERGKRLDRRKEGPAPEGSE